MSISVLVADDSKLSRRSVIRSLPQELTYNIAEATNGEEAIHALSEQKFELLLLDLTMPTVDGIGVLKFLNTSESAPNVIVISADFQPEKQKNVMELGAKRFLRKPLDKDELAMVFFELGYL
ncbi:response regulator [Alteromonas sp. KUL42]|uniref:response regulator n=1 Tax=Alteromonas sp. KUL42 TaxID=2480797 RepID=UPI00103641A3|nr:response regulator [Alteromonas sp. KUL42]TAP37424.1 response regulator [Alteromonas sp. KUL42]GEA05815.1 response regulator [Alteromonas sp. KUL42]